MAIKRLLHKNINGKEIQWLNIKKEAIKRDDFKCVNCGKQPFIRIKMAFSKGGKYPVKVISDRRPDYKLVGDHIIAVALGGEEYDVNNVQTLCISCHKIKTKEDMRKIKEFKKNGTI